MNGPPPGVVVASANRRSQADEIAGAVKAGCSVAAIGPQNNDDVLDLAMVALAAGGVRVLTLRPPWDSVSFISQFAAEWRASGQETELGAGPITLPKPSGERFAMLLYEAHLIPPETFRHLERLAQTWPGMQLVFAGLPAIVGTVQGKDYPTLANRVSRIIETSLVSPRPPLQDSVGSADLADAVPVSSAVPNISTWMSDDYPPIEASPRAEVAPTHQQSHASVQTEVAQPPLRRRAPGRVLTWSLAALVALAIMTTTAVPRLPWSSRTVIPVTQSGLTDSNPAPTPATVPAETLPLATGVTTAAQESAVKQTSPIAAASRQGAATENIPDAPASATETPPAANEPVQEAAPVIAPVSPPPPASAHPEAASNLEAEDSPGPVFRPSPSSPSASPPSPSLPSPSPPSPSPPAPSLSSGMADAMTRRGQAMLDIGDVSAARLLLARAAGAGSGAAALAMGTTFDAATLERIGAVGIVADPVVAAVWYRFALGLGEDRARAMLDALPIDILAAKPKDAP